MLVSYMQRMRNNNVDIRIVGSKHTNVQGLTSAQLSHGLGGWGQNLGHTICYACKLSTTTTAPNSIENPEPMLFITIPSTSSQGHDVCQNFTLTGPY